MPRKKTETKTRDRKPMYPYFYDFSLPDAPKYRW